MLTAFDVGVGILVLISAILATARGLTREVLSLATWAGSAAIAIYMWQFHPEIARGFIAEQIVADVEATTQSIREIATDENNSSQRVVFSRTDGGY